LPSAFEPTSFTANCAISSALSPSSGASVADPDPVGAAELAGGDVTEPCAAAEPVEDPEPVDDADLESFLAHAANVNTVRTISTLCVVEPSITFARAECA
jgi:hypothetical protein